MIDSSTADYPGTDRFQGRANDDPSVAIVRKVKAHMKERANQEYPAEPGCEEPWTDQQEEAMLYVVEGLPVTEAAQNVAVNRRTVHRWMHHPRFQKALKERDQKMALTLQVEMAEVVQESFSSLNQALQQDDYAAALKYLKKVGVLDGTPIFEKDAPLLDKLTKPAPAETTDANEEVGQVRHADGKEGDSPEKTENCESEEMGQVRHSEPTAAEKVVDEFQQEALDLVRSGESLFAAIPLDAYGITVLRKIMSKPAFQAGLKTAHQHLQAHWSLQGKHLALLAVKCIRRALADHNGRVAITVLKGLGVL